MPARHLLCAARAAAPPSPRSFCVLAPGLSEAGGNTLKPHGAGRTLAGFTGRAGSSTAALALCCLHKAFLQLSGSHPRHGAGNYRWLQLASIGNSPTAEPFPICSSPDAGRLPALCREYKAWGGTCPQWARGVKPQAISPHRFWPHSQLIDEDVRHPDAFRGEGDLCQVVEVRWVPPEEFVCPMLGTRERGLGGGGPSHPTRTTKPRPAPCHGNQSSTPSLGRRKGSSSGYRTSQWAEARNMKAVPSGSCPTEVLSSPGMGSALLHSCRAACLSQQKILCLQGCSAPGGVPQQGRGEVAWSHLLTCLYQM